jgi:hypothetical protein
MKTTKNGYRLTKNGKPILEIEEDAIVKDKFEGNSIKVKGCYYYFNRNQNGKFIYLM